jgi:hypothetical protein
MSQCFGPAPVPAPSEPLRACSTNPILSRRGNPGLVLPVRFDASIKPLRWTSIQKTEWDWCDVS